MFKTIICPTDFSEASYEGLKRAVNLARASEGELCVLYVDRPLGGTAESRNTAQEAARRNQVISHLSDVLKERVPVGVRSRSLFKEGDAAEEITRAAYEEKADLLVLTVHGASGFRCGDVGDVANAVLQTVPCPVLVINGPTTGQAACDVPRLRALLAERSGAMRPEYETAHSGPHALHLDGD